MGCPTPKWQSFQNYFTPPTTHQVQLDLYISEGGHGDLPRGGSTIGSTKQSLDGLGGSRKCLVFRDLWRVVVPWPGNDEGLRYHPKIFKISNLLKGLWNLRGLWNFRRGWCTNSRTKILIRPLLIERVVSFSSEEKSQVIFVVITSDLSLFSRWGRLRGHLLRRPRRFCRRV